MLKMALLPIMLLGVVATGCTNGDPTVSGTWTLDSKAGSAGQCQDTGLFADTVGISATATPGFTYSDRVPCDDAGFSFQVPKGASDLQITFTVMTYDQGNEPSNTIKIAGTIDDDEQLGDVQLAGE
jgi:hypothetical protein